ncbi:fibronectin type-III domain-containing protein 3A-like isoform X2 [Anneissia japonica]|uniref:fibronectin type-III domain-containing protein 3A-like isoform X2 n=1 Tax=Anneissia japonica TaxID=1529436 RepID=UPI001425A6EA|nr:fibronectin type-III domain-containing protein 3A-like isoform X2 [Anneissia japonica]
MSTSKTISSNSAVNTDQNCNKDKAPAILLNGDIPAMDINTNGTDDMKTQKGIILENGTKICTPEHFPNVQEQNGQHGNGPHNQDFTTQTGEIIGQSGEYTVPTGVFTGTELTAPFGCGREFVPHNSYILPQQDYSQIPPDFPVQENQVTDMTQGQMSEIGQDDGGNQVQDQKYEFYIHIKAGEAFPVGNGEQVQYIHGPTIIRLLASSPQMPQLNIVHTGHGPVPLPSNMGMASTTMPTNVALTPAMQESDNLQQGVYNTGHGIVQQQMYTQMFQGVQIYNQMIAYPNIPPHIPPHVTQNQAGMRPMQPHVVIPRFTHRQHSPPQSNDQSHLQEQPRPVNQQRKRDDRTDKQREKLQRRLRDRYHNSNHPPSPQTSPRNSHSSRHDGNNSGNKSRRRTSPRSEEIEEDPNIRRKREVLSCIESPEVTEILARSAHLGWNFQPSNDESSPNMERSKIKYEVTVSTQGRQPSIFDSDTETQFELTDLKPATEYHASVSAIFENIRGLPSKPSSFTTSGCEPDEPSMPKCAQKNKNFLVIKWNAPNDNGSKIISYILETDMGISGGGFNEIFKGSQKQFRYTKLQPATKYSFQLKAVNEFGESTYSTPMHCYTSGTVPATPEAPSLKEAGVTQLELTWPPVESDVTRYILQMDDQTNKHGFKVVFNGDENSHTCKNLQRNTEYRFKLLANNDQGDSCPSEIVAFRTKPDSPQAPPKPTLKGKLHSDYFKVSWDPPRDNGGATVTKYYLEISECQDENWVSYYSGPDREKTLNHLRPGGTYQLRVSCQSIAGISPPSDVSTFTTPAICPGKCFQPRVHGRPKANLLNLRWGPPAYDGGSAITEYSIEMTSADNDIAKEVHVGPATCLDCTVNGLLPGRCYTFKLRAFNKVGNGHFSDPLEVRTGCGPPEPPTELRIETRLLSTTVWASWEKPYCNGAEITEYRLEKACEQNVFSMVYCGDQCSCEVRNLLPASEYQFRVQAINQAGSGPFSAVASITTPPSVPAPVSNLQLVDYSCDFLTVSWTEPKNYGCEIIAYNIYIGDGPALHLGNVNEYCIEDLEPDTKYRIRIRAVNDIGEGPFSTLLKAQTLPLPPDPPKLECVLYGHQSLKLKWGDNSRPSLENNQYSLEMEDKRGRFGPVYSGPNMNYKVSKLTEQTEYRFRIYSSNDSGDGPYSEVYKFATGKAPPGTMKSPKVINITPVSCEVQWQEISPLQEDKIYYHLENDYTKVYQGPDTKFTLINLTPNTEYRVRVCAVRLPADDSTELIGPFSPGTTFTTSPQPTGSYNADIKDVEESQRQPMPDELMILIFVVVLVVCAIILALLLASYS